jgi:single-strand DNA-binding protein
MNRVCLCGRLVRDPELRYTTNGAAVAKFTLAVDRGYTNKQGEKETDFIFISVWRGLAENVAKYTRKGSLVALEGRLQVSSYQNSEGRTVWTTEVVADSVKFLDNKGKREQQEHGDDPFQQVGKPIDIDAEFDLNF